LARREGGILENLASNERNMDVQWLKGFVLLESPFVLGVD
jgi:hypothetical protein